ncbi:MULTISPECIES: GrpB family protein [Dyadobacter]|uniref:GrpB family protein n=1 Tax=Dyadobacter TaxID=120831 RepID=UPI0035B5AF45
MKIALPVFKSTFHHIGSTAVPGLAAKDIIDIQVSVSCFDPQIETPHNVGNRMMTSL